MVFKAGELKNRLKNSRYINFDKEEPFILKPVNLITLSVGDRVYVKSLSSEATILSINQKKKEAEVYVGSIKSIVKLSDLYNAEKPKQEKAKINVSKSTAFMPKLEINVVGKTSLEALTEVEYFIDQAVVNGAEEIKIIHGIGEGILLKEIRAYLKTDKRIAEFRRGKYGEGENGVTIVKLK
ncbi:MAG: Smr/MutS family protein [Clostridia bacterium]|nr:Smr/MutS family protein [Clostridia bacterium]